MQRCLDIAAKATGNTYPNPVVGCVIVHNDIIIGEGYHKKAGCPHAEVNAINSLKNPALIPESTLYVSLEPCAHFGKTPPCADLIVRSGFKKVVIGALDSHDKVNGKGKKILENAGMEVVSGVMQKECENLNRRFFTFHQKKRPFIVLKWAESADGFIDRNFQPAAISNSITKQFVHHLRTLEHAILVGTKTALNDNPSLTTREISGRNPVRILIDYDLKVPADFHILNDNAETVVFNGIKTETKNHIRFIKISKENGLNDVLKELYKLNIQSVLVEGGATILQQFISQKLWDEAVIIKNPKLMLTNGTKAPIFSCSPEASDKYRDNYVEFYVNRD